MVTVYIIGQLQQHVADPQYDLELPVPMTVTQLLETHEDKLGALRPFLTSAQLMVTINKKIGTIDSPVKDGDTVKLTYTANFSYEGARWHNP